MSLSTSSDDFANRIRLWRVTQHLTQAEAAKQLNIDRAYLSQIERGRAPGNSLRTRFELLEQNKLPKKELDSFRNLDRHNVPILSWAQAGQAIDFDQLPSDWTELIPTAQPDEHAFGVRLRGDSMEPKFFDGDIAVLLPGTAPTNGEVVVANIKDHGVVCKLMHVQLDKNLITLSSYNPAYPPLEYHRDDFNWIFPVAEVIRQLRRR